MRVVYLINILKKSPLVYKLVQTNIFRYRGKLRSDMWLCSGDIDLLINMVLNTSHHVPRCGR